MEQGTPPDHTDVDALPLTLRRFAKQVLGDAGEWRDSNKLTKVRRGFFIRPNLSLQYTLDPGMVHKGQTMHIEGEEWDWKGLEALWEERIRLSAACLAVRDLLSADGRAESMLKLFSHRLVVDGLGASAAPGIDKYVEILIRDVKGEPRNSHALLWLNGIEVPDEPIAVSDELTFRRPKPEDLLERVHDDAIHYAHAIQPQIRFSCIAELQGSVSDPGELQRRAERIVSALRLFRVGSVWGARIDFSVESFSIFGHGSSLFAPHINARISYALSQTDVPALKRFLKVVTPLVPTPGLSTTEEPHFLSSAFAWYSDALLSTGPNERGIASAVACLEALFLSDNPQSEITYRLVRRVAALLGMCGWPATEARKQLTDAYDVRSRYVHGSVPNPKKKLTHDQLFQLFRTTAESARIAFLIMAQLTEWEKLNHNGMIGAIEDSLIDDAHRTKLIERCKLIEFGRGLRMA
jgi:Apea-like HEPN